jgi:hypothetical protein
MYHPAATTGNSGGGYPQDDLIRRIIELEQRIAYIENREEGSRRTAQSEAAKVVESAKRVGVSCNDLELRVTRDISRLDATLQHEYQTQHQRREAMEGALRETFVTEVEHIRQEVAKREASQSDSVQHRVMALSEQLDALAAAFQHDTDAQAAQMEDVRAFVDREVRALRESVDSTTKQREASEMSVLGVLEDMCVQLQKQIANERRERTESHKRLERLLLEATAGQAPGRGGYHHRSTSGGYPGDARYGNPQHIQST